MLLTPLDPIQLRSPWALELRQVGCGCARARREPHATVCQGGSSGLELPGIGTLTATALVGLDLVFKLVADPATGRADTRSIRVSVRDKITGSGPDSWREIRGELRVD
jgi:hypothetical protein